MRDYYVVQIKLPSGKTMISSMMLLADAEKLADELPQFEREIKFVCKQ